MRSKLALFCSGCFISLQSIAAPSDLFLQAKDLINPSSSKLQLKFSADAVNDTLDVFDIRESEGVSDKSMGDYQGFNLGAQYDFNPNWAIEGTYWHRKIEFSDDSNKIQSALLGVRYTPDLDLKTSDAFTLRGSIWSNRADTLSKTSPTRVNQRTFNAVNVEDPEDFQVQLDALFSRKLDHMNQLNAFVSLGYSKVEVNKLQIQATQQGCLMNVNIDSSNQYSGNLAQPCKTGNITVTDLKISGNASEFGLDMQQDLNYDAYFASIGASWNWKYQNFESQLSYQYQQLWRKEIDDRISNFGSKAIHYNQSLGLKLDYAFTPHLNAFLQGELYQHNFIGQIPFLYNGVTASRLDKRYGLASIGLTLHSF